MYCSVWLFFYQQRVNTLPVFFISSEESFQFMEDYAFERWSHIDARAGHPIQSNIDGDIALIIRDDVVVSDILFEEWEKIISTAPSDWDILQMWTDNPVVTSHCENLEDPWITWFPEHVGKSVYFVRRQALSSMHTDADFTKWQTYTSTRFFVQTTLLREQPTTVQKWPTVRDQILILMASTIENKHIFKEEVNRWNADFASIYADWYVTLVVRNNEMSEWLKRSWPKHPRLTLVILVREDQYNKFEVLKSAIPRMIQYERVVIKDADMNIAGFPWRTFVHKSLGAIISSPLRQIKDDKIDERQWFKFQDGALWKSKYTNMFKSVETRASDFLEQFFVMMDGDFASWFFNIVLDKKYLTDLDGIPTVSNWGPDVIWCGAAASWTSEKIPCVVVPVVSKHDDTRQVAYWNSSPRRKYTNLQQLAHFEQAFPNWLFYNSSNFTH
tara:strand:- start:5579 stop:6904 length:1326 start_codon:yes stop_codon:yes gene_type:complete